MTPLPDAISNFMVIIRADGLSPETLRWYQSGFRRMTEHFLNAPDIESITLSDMRAYIASMYGQSPQRGNNQQLTMATISSQIRLQRRFWKWCAEEYQLPANPVIGIKFPRAVKAVPKAVTDVIQERTRRMKIQKTKVKRLSAVERLQHAADRDRPGWVIVKCNEDQARGICYCADIHLRTRMMRVRLGRTYSEALRNLQQSHRSTYEF